MSEMHFRDVNARVVQFADVINNHATLPVEARVENGYRLLDLRSLRCCASRFRRRT